MTTPINTSNYSILSNRENFDDAQKKQLDAAKIEIADVLDLDKRMVNRSNISQALETQRVENKKWYPDGEIEIRPGITAKIDETKYKDILDEYKKQIQEKPEGFEKTLHQLDTQLGEQIILDNKCAIEFKSTDNFIDNKNAETESKAAYEWLNKLETYENKIERLTKKINNVDYFIIKWTEEELENIKKIENELRIKLEEEIIAQENINSDIELINKFIQTSWSSETIDEKNLSSEEAKEKLREIKEEENKNTKGTFSIMAIAEEIGKFLTTISKQESVQKSTPTIIENKEEIVQEENKPTEEKKIEEAKVKAEIEEVKAKEIEKKKEELFGKENIKESVENINLGLLVNRDNLADDIRKTREWKEFPSGTITIKTGISISLESQKDFEEFKTKYIEAGNNSLRLKELDTEFAERIILDNPQGTNEKTKKYYIQINNDETGKDTKTQEQLIQESLSCRDKLNNLWYNVEYITYEEKNENTDRIKELKEMEDEIARQQRAIDALESELNSKWLYYTETGRIAKKEELEKMKTKLWKLQNDYDALKKEINNMPSKKYHIIRQKEGDKPIPVIPEEDLELNAVISDMGTDVHRERVSLETEEELKARYKKLARYNMPARAYLFLSRWAKRKRMIKAKMKAMAGKAFSDTGDMTKDQALNEKTTDASDRHDFELQHNLDKVAKANKVTLQNPLVNNICKQYLNDTIKEDQFQKQFNAIVDNDANIQAVLKWQKITHIGTNILEKLRQQRAKTALTHEVDKEINLYLVDNNQSHIDTINRLISDHIKYNQKNPDFMKDYEEFLNKTPGAINKLQTYLKHQKSMMQMQNTNVKMNIDILIKGKSAYQIDNKDRQKWLKYKIGNALDKLPRWVQAGWFIGLSVGTGLLTWGLGFGAVAAAAITTGVTATSVGGMNALKKRTHFTKEQNTHEKNVVTDYRNEQKKIAERQNKALNGKRYQWKTYKAKRQLALYDQTTQENIQISNSISDTITDLSSKIGGLDAKEENYMKKNLIQGRVRLRYYRENGHNFLASNEKEQIEKDMKRLEKSLVLWVNKLWKTLTDIETMQATDDLGNNLTYDILKKDLTNSYNKSLIQFKRERRNLAIKYGVATAALSAGMSIGAQYAFSTGIFGGEKVPGVSPSELTTKTHDEFVLGKAELLDSWSRNNIYNTGAKVFWMNHIPDGSTITLDYGAGTNLVPVMPGHLTEAMYNAKIQTVMQNINGLNLDSNNKFTIMRELMQQPWKDTWAWTNFTNDYLQGMRCAETIEQAAKAFADSGKTNLNFNLDFNSAVSPTTEKIANASFTLKTPWVPWSWSARGKLLQFPVFFNTFKDVKKQEKEKQTTPQQ